MLRVVIEKIWAIAHTDKYRVPGNPMAVTIASESNLFDALSLENTVQHILETRRITRIDQQRLMKFGMASLNNQHAVQLMNQVSDALRVGRLRVID